MLNKFEGVGEEQMETYISKKKSFSIIFSNKDYVYLSLINVLQGLLSAIIVPVFPLWVMNEVHVSVSHVFYLLSVIGLGNAVINTFVGSLSDKLGKRKLFFELSMCLSIIRNVLYAFFPYITVIIIASWITQLSASGITFAILDDKIKANGDENHSGIINSIIRGAISVGFILGPWVGTMLISIMSYRTFFILYAMCYLLLLLLIRYLIHDSTKITPKKEVIKNKKKESIRIRSVYLTVGVIIFTVLIYAGIQSINPLLTLYVNERYETWVIGALLGFSVVFEIPFFIIVGKMVDKIGTERTLYIGIISEILYFALLSISTNIYVLFALQILGAFHTVILFISVMIYIQSLFEGKTAFSTSMFFSILMVTGTLSNGLIGLVLHSGYSKVFLLFAFCSLGGLTILLALSSYKRKQSSYLNSSRD
ncbi:MFS transporter [Paenibacillus medicaginis]|uniref:MFS transporter n=1 Tax=Paenibacillus medicaginis TaxID=1470560 RepID=A0ABV5BVE9_9BACL